MTEAFDLFLSTALAPPQRAPDAAFALRVRALCALDDRLRRQRQAALRLVLVQALALGAVAAGLLLLGRSATIAAFVAGSPALALAGTIAAFALLVIAIAPPRRANGAAL